MFHPYSVQGGTATLDPQISGMNGQSRMPEINSYPQNFATPTHVPGYGTPIQYAHPTSYQHPAFVNPFVNYAPTAFGWNSIPSPMMTGYPTTVNPYAGQFNPFVNPVNPFVNPMNCSNPFVPAYQPIVNTWNPYAATPTFTGLNPLACCPTPASFINPTFGCHPFMTTPFVNTPYGIIPNTINPWAHYSFRAPVTNTPAFCGSPTTLTGIPAIDSTILSSCGTQGIYPNVAAQSLSTLASQTNPFATGLNPFITSTLLNSTLQNSLCNPFTSSFNPLFHNTTNPFSHLSSVNFLNSCNPIFGGLNSVNTPWNWSNVWNHFPTPNFGTGIGFNTGYNGINTGSFNPIATMATATSPFGSINNPFFSPTNIAHGIPGFSTGAVNPMVASACGPVCCN